MCLLESEIMHCSGCLRFDHLHHVDLLLDFDVKCYNSFRKQLCLHIQTSTYLSSILRSRNNLPDKNTSPFLPWIYSKLLQSSDLEGSFSSSWPRNDSTRMPFGRTRALHVISIWRSEWQEEQLSRAICNE